MKSICENVSAEPGMGVRLHDPMQGAVIYRFEGSLAITARMPAHF